MSRTADVAFALSLPPPGSRARLRELHAQLRGAIFDGRLPPGLQLPASRALAQALQVSRNTVVSVYDLLLSEGYLVARPGAGTFVAEAPVRRGPAPPAETDAPDRRLAEAWRSRASLPQIPGAPAAYDFRLGLPDRNHFPFEVWRRLSDRALRQFARPGSAPYAEPEGRPALREAAARHVAFTRAVACTPQDLVITAGAQQAFDLIARILVTPGETVVAVEEPGYGPLRAAFTQAGARLAPTPVDAEGLVVEALPAEARLICVTPSHQCPLGVAMSPARRAALLDFARTHDALVLEDDYDGEFRFGGRPLDALQTLDGEGRVFYVGTFSKTLFSALRLGFVVAPPWARDALAGAKRVADLHSPAVVQDTLAAFIAEGHMARHVRRMRKIYGERREVLLAALTARLGDRLSLWPAQAGLHVAAELAPDLDADAVTRAAAARGVVVEPLARYALGPPRNGLVFGYGLVPAERIEAGIARLAEAIG